MGNAEGRDVWFAGFEERLLGSGRREVVCRLGGSQLDHGRVRARWCRSWVRDWRLKRRLGVGILRPWRLIFSAEDPVADSSKTIAPFAASHGKG